MDKIKFKYLSIKAASLLKEERELSSYSFEDVLSKVNISSDELKLYESEGLRVPGYILYQLLTLYSARVETIMFFCCLPLE